MQHCNAISESSNHMTYIFPNIPVKRLLSMSVNANELIEAERRIYAPVN